MTAIYVPFVQCNFCEAKCQADLGTRVLDAALIGGIVESWRGRASRATGWASWAGQDGETYDACPTCAPAHSWA